MPDAAQPVAWIRGPKADQLQASDVTGNVNFNVQLMSPVYVHFNGGHFIQDNDMMVVFWTVWLLFGLL